MNCSELKASACEYFAKKLSAEDHKAFEEHAASCAPCGRMIEAAKGMSCEHFADFLHDYFDGELPAEQSSVFDRHMDMCPPCKDYLVAYEKTVHLGKASLCKGDAEELPPVPDALVQAILAARRKTC